MSDRLNIAIIGTRGIPARYGGFETFAEELGAELAARGHRVSVYCRYPFGGSRPELASHRGVKLVYLPALHQKYLETPVHSFFSLLHLRRSSTDVVLLCNAANSPFLWVPRLRGLPVAVNVDGIERMRGKWSAAGRLWYSIGERCSVAMATRLVADADCIAQYYRETYGAPSTIIRYGARSQSVPPGETLKRFGLQPHQYLLYVSRLEPENNALGVIRAYVKSGVKLPLVIVGDAPYAEQYKSLLRREASESVVFAGFQFGSPYYELRTSCLLYIQATEVGGTHPALVEAMAWGNCIIANRVPEHEEVLGDAGEYYEKNNFDQLADKLAQLTSNAALRDACSGRAALRAKEYFQWSKIADRYETLFREMIR